MTRRSLTQAQRDAAIRQLKAGGSVTSVAEAVGSTAPAVAILKRTDVRIRDSGTTDGKPVSARLSPVEIEALERLKDAYGFRSNSDALRALVRAASGMLEFDPDTAAKLDEVRGELRKIGVNVNQVALAANKGRIDFTRHEWKALNELRQALPGVRIYLQAVVDEQRRRGSRLFRKFIEADRG